MIVLSQKINKHVFKLFFFMLSLQYFLPFIFDQFIRIKLEQIYTINLSSSYILLISIPIIIIFSMDYLLPKFQFNFKLNLANYIYSELMLWFLSIAFFILSLKFFKDYSISFRHQNEISSEPYIIGLYFLQAYFKAYFFLRIISKIKSKNKTIDIFIILAFAFSISSSFQIIQVISGVILLFNKQSIIFVSSTKKNIIKSISYFILIIFGLLSIVFMGVANKIGVENTQELTRESELQNLIFDRVSVRQSTAYVSFIIGFQNYIEDFNFSKEAFFGQLNNLINRFSILTGGQPQKAEIWGINRLNYLKIYHFNDKPRTGTSPGLMASYFYIPFFPINIIALSFYIIYVLRLISKNIKTDFSIIGLIISYFYMLGFFESPIELINIIGPSFVYVFFVVTGLKGKF